MQAALTRKHIFTMTRMRVSLLLHHACLSDSRTLATPEPGLALYIYTLIHTTNNHPLLSYLISLEILCCVQVPECSCTQSAHTQRQGSRSRADRYARVADCQNRKMCKNTQRVMTVAVCVYIEKYLLRVP